MKGPYLVLFLLIFGLGFALGQVVPETLVRDQPPAVADPLPAALTTEETRDIEIFRRSTGSVVSIRSVALRYNLFSLDVMRIPSGSGSGFVWDRQGHIVTNYHVVKDGNAFVVTLSDQSTWEAKVVGVAPDKDLAVVRIDAPARDLAPLTLGQSADLVVGQKVLALGNPFGLDHSLTVGVLSALGRELESPGGRTIRDVLQTDAAINPGNSGGPLLDTGGRLVGVNTAIVSPSGGSTGIGFAIPVDTVRRLVPQLIKHGRPIQPGIGVQIRPIRGGLVIMRVSRGLPAEKAGLEGIQVDRRGRYALGDVIVAADGNPVDTRGDLLDVFEAKGIGGTVTLTIERDGRERDVRVELVKLE